MMPKSEMPRKSAMVKARKAAAVASAPTKVSTPVPCRVARVASIELFPWPISSS